MRAGWRLVCIGTIAIAIAIGLLGLPGHDKVAGASTVSVNDPSLEADANHDGVPDCWQGTGSGKTRYSFARTTDAHTGGFAEKVAISRYWSGSRQLLVQMGSSGCGPAVTAGHSYTLTAWYKGTGQAHFTALYRNTSGTWVSWVSGPALPVTTGWTQGSYLAPALPAGATEISFGIALQSAGSLTTDDYAMTDSGSSTATASSSTPAPSLTTSTAAASSPTSSPTSSTATASTTSTTTSSASASPTGTASTNQPPSAAGYFSLKPVGAWSSLPSGDACKGLIRYSTWEPRPDNTKRNNTVPNPADVHAAFAARPKSTDGTYSSQWDSWLQPRIDGQFTGTTDEIFQWAACKWGLPDNVLRAVAVRESTWYQYETYPSGRCVLHFSCGDMMTTASPDSSTYCNFLAQYGYDYQHDYGAGLCPKTFGIVGVMDWEAPSWGAMPNNQNGTFPFNRNSTAFAVDYLGSQLRGCYEGWQSWLKNTGTGTYAAGDLWGCVGSWYSGDWHSSAADGYISRVQGELTNLTWLASDWATNKPGCDPTYGCPGPDTLP
jgi:hypothetical protein